MPVSGFRFALVSTLAAVMALSFTGVAQAAPPSNDERASATVVTALPFTDTSSTVEATAGADDPSSNCYGMGNSVWYTFTAPADMDVLVQVRSNFDTVVDVYRQTQEALETVDCYEEQGYLNTLRVQMSAGTTYHYVVRGWNVGGDYEGITSGDFNFDLRQTPPSLSSAVVDVQKGTVTRQGAVTLTGTIRCDAAASYASFAVNGSQVNRRFRAEGGQSAAVPCSTTPTSWSMTFVSQTGVNFVSGGMTATLFGDIYGDWGGYAQVSGSQTVRLTSVR